MRIELRILSGARAGQSEVFDQQVILVGRKLSNDLKFDAQGDLDVSAQHAEIIQREGRWYVADKASTNGTYVNGVAAKGQTLLKDGDVVAFGKNGPTVEVRAKGDITGKTPAVPRTAPTKAQKGAPQSTQERVAVAVQQQTRSLKTTLLASMVGLGALAVFAYWFGTREGSRKVDEMRAILAATESTTAVLRQQAGGDTTLANALTRQIDSLKIRVQAAASEGNAAKILATTQELQARQVKQQGLALMDFSVIGDRNDAAVAFLITELDGKPFGGTAFGITRDGLLVTNRHNVRSARTGAPSTRLEVIFANTSIKRLARIVKVSDVDSMDLALIQIEQPGDYPTVAGVSRLGDIAPGAPTVTIGFPRSLELPMEGNIVKTTLSPAHVGKRLRSVLQLDNSFGAHGLSGAPVFNSSGHVVGVVWGGPKEDTRVIYAVPSDRLVDFIGELGKSIIR